MLGWMRVLSLWMIKGSREDIHCYSGTWAIEEEAGTNFERQDWDLD